MRPGAIMQQGLNIAGLTTWLVIGLASVGFYVEQRHATAPSRWMAFALCYAAFIALLLFETGRRSGRTPRHLRLVLLALQSICALSIASLSGRPVGFIFLTLVAAQMPSLLGGMVATCWVLAQSTAMGLVYARIVPAWEARSYVAVYLGFQAFAFLIVRAASAELAAREELARTNAWLRATHALLSESGRLAERERISRDLHDVLGHHLAAMSLNLEAARHLSDGRSRVHVENAQTLARALLGDVRTLVRELHEKGGTDLKRVLGALVDGVLRPQVHLVLPAELVDVDHELCQILLRCVQEIVTNAIKHSAANNLWIELRSEHDALILEARDDGHGAPVVCPGLGLRGMRDRLAARGGQLDFDGAGGAGFRLRALVR